MSRSATVAVIALLFSLLGLEAAEPRQRTDNGQFTIYCENAKLRHEVASFAMRTKDELLDLLGEPDSWRRPIVIDLALAPLAPGRSPIQLNVVDSEAGMKIALSVRIGDQPEDVNLQKHLIRSLLIEMMYRETGVQGGTHFAEPPWWLVEGATQLARKREEGVDSDLFRRLVETNKLPPIERFLSEKPEELGPTALALDRSLAMCLVQLLVEQPNGRRRLAALVRSWPDHAGDSLGCLQKEFPAFASGPASLQKWWTLNLARFAASDRYRSLTLEETEHQLGALLEFDVKHDKTGATRHFTIGEFDSYRKIPGYRKTIAAQHAALLALSARSSALFRPVINSYEEAFTLLGKGKTWGMRDRLEKADLLRQAILQRGQEISDYLNWFQATQLGGRSKAFDAYLRTAEEISRRDKHRNEQITSYLDQIEEQLR